ncbi:hypothetical protein BCR42DRAFT_413027 [Absidia repens]|uniref:MHYT domain-containing protein n=1 Tax=Absidia repens TaxID=90262 RepID=A0A1X2IKH3_9FUNG|nr:hypothetical protein BCR42DRAFT_413027 [Absidia repens]
MEGEVAAAQQFSGPIIFVSFVISVIGSMTTLELLSRRTHIHGRKNWYLLLSAALAMGSVGIWSMHFIGNNSLTLSFQDHSQSYQLAYSGGYTFASLVVSIACMFVSFSFVGVSEHVQIYRILLSGVLAGLGIVLMHYLGQFAIEYFHVSYKAPYVVGAVIIACTAVTAALWIFFKLREHWMNQWYKRLGCAIIMAVAVCGMHYTAMVGTDYHDNGDGVPPPSPLLPTPALIGVICGVVVIACLALFYVGVKCSMQRIAENSDKRKKRLVVDMVIFDSQGRMMVDIDGVLPGKEVLSDIQFKSTRQEFSSSHPLFIRLFQVVTQWSTTPTLEDYDRTSHSDEFNIAERRFHEATSSFMETLHLEDASELGLLYESVIKTHTIIQPNFIQQKRIEVKQRLQNIRHSLHSTQFNQNTTDYNDAYSLSETTPPTPTVGSNATWTRDPKKNVSTNSFDHSAAMESNMIGRKKKSSSTMYLDYEQHTATPSLSDSQHTSNIEGDEERHIVLVRQLTADKDIHRFMTHGYRFTDASFIAKIMAAKLHVPTDYLLNHFRDMQLLAQSSLRLTGATSPRVMVGLLGLIDENQTYDDVQLIVDKKSRYGFPIVDLIYSDTGEQLRHLLPEEKQCLSYMLRDHTLHDMTDINQYVDIQPRTSMAMTHSSANTLDGTVELSHSLASSSGAISTSTTINTNTPTVLLSTTNLDQELANRNNQQQQRLSMTTPISPTSQSTTLINPVTSASTTQRFAKAMELASQKLMNAVGMNGMHLGLSNAALQGDVIDLPAYSLTNGPCTLILFRTCLRSRGTMAAIQQHAVSEPISCIPYSLAPSLAYAITQRAADHYQKSVLKSSWGSELQQQMLYGSFTHQNHNTSASSYYYMQQHYQHQGTDDGTIEMNHIMSDSEGRNINHSRAHSDGSKRSAGDISDPKRISSIMDQNMPTMPLPPYRTDMMTSLSPPPRVKRNRRPLSLDTNDITQDQQHQKSAASAPTTPKYQPLNEIESNLIILSAKDRFLWLDQTIVECLHSVLS